MEKYIYFILAPYGVMKNLGVKDRELSYSQIIPGHFVIGDTVVPVWKFGKNDFLSFDGKKMKIPFWKKFHKTKVGMSYDFGEYSSFTLVEDDGHHKKKFEMEQTNPIGVKKLEKFYADLHYNLFKDVWGTAVNRIKTLFKNGDLLGHRCFFV